MRFLNLSAPLLVLSMMITSWHTSSAQALSCINELNVSLAQDCTLQITAERLLSSAGSGDYTVLTTTAARTTVADNMVTQEHLWTQLTVKVTDNVSNNSCWGTVNVEDKLGPAIECQSRIIDCFDLHTYAPSVTDNCTGGDVTVEILSNQIDELDCDPDFVKIIRRGYKATDGFGNTSSCTQTLSLRHFDTDEISWPEDLVESEGTNLTCSQVTQMNGIPEPSFTGFPFIVRPDGPDADMAPDTISLYPFTDTFCNVAIEYADVVTKVIGCRQVIMRTWRVTEWNCLNSPQINWVQTIEIADTEAPMIDCGQPQVLLNSDGLQGCTASHVLALPAVSDDCGDLFSEAGGIEIDARLPGLFLDDVTQPIPLTVNGPTVVEFVAYDACGNSASCTVNLDVIDNTSPTAVCDQNSVVSLRSDGTAIAPVGTFDDGSFDDCEMIMSVVRRVDSSCGCSEPRFQNLDFLGNHGARYFYLSERAASATKAQAIAQALGGNVADLWREPLADWVTAELSVDARPVYLGLTRHDATSAFTWSDGRELTYTNWAPGQVDADGVPLVAGDYVILNVDGLWEIVSGAANYGFLVEFAVDCGFSETIDFCCNDAGQGQVHMVQLRVIDASGGFNDCMANVIVQDKVEPVVTCPQDITFNCAANLNFSDPDLFAEFTTSDQCGDLTITGPQVDMSEYNTLCNSGRVVRTFLVSDSGSQVACVQTLTSDDGQPFDPASIIPPDDVTVEGCLTDDFSVERLQQLGVTGQLEPGFTTSGCSNVSVSITKDWPISTQSGSGLASCYQIIRSWTLIDWCSLTVNGTPQEYVWQQVININDTAPPEINRPETCQPLEVLATGCDGSTGTANFTFHSFAVDNCVAPTGQIVERLYFNGNPQVVASGISNGFLFNSGTARPNGYPIGDHRFIVSFTDECGNTDSCEKTVSVLSNETATVDCRTVNVPLQLWNNVPVLPLNASTLVDVSYPCTTFVPTVTFDNGTGSMQLGCDDLSGTQQFVTVHVEDSQGLNASCTATINVENSELCGLAAECTAAPEVFFFYAGNDNTIVFDQTAILDGRTHTPVNLDCLDNGLLFMDINVITEANTCSSPGSLFVQLDFNSDDVIDYEQFVVSENLFIDFSELPIGIPEGDHIVHITYVNCASGCDFELPISVECGQFPPCDDIVIESDCQSEINLDLGLEPNVFFENREILVLNPDGSSEISSESNITLAPVPGSGFIDIFTYQVDDNGGSVQFSCQISTEIICEQLPQNLEIDFCESTPDQISIDLDCQDNNGINIPIFVFANDPNCAPSDIFTVARVDYFGDGDDIEFFAANDFLDLQLRPIPGDHIVSIEAEGCGDLTFCERMVTVNCLPNGLTLLGCEVDTVAFDCDTPVPYHLAIDAVGAPPNCNVEMFLTTTYTDGRTELFLGVDFIDMPIDPFLTGFGQYTYEVTTSGDCGPVTTCTGAVYFSCTQPFAGVVSGTVHTENRQFVEDVQVSLLGAEIDPVMTDAQGTFELSSMDAGGDYLVIPHKDGDDLVGISTIDLVKIQRHILGLEPLDSAYKMIAADIDASGKVNGVDLVELRKLILGLYDVFPANDSWRMVDADYQFTNIETAPEVDFAEDYLITDLSSDRVVDFIGVKVGDVDNSFLSLREDEVSLRSSDKPITLTCEDAYLQAGDIHEVAISGPADKLAALQGAFKVDVDKADLIEILSSEKITAAHLNETRQDEGVVRFVYHNAHDVRLEETLLTLVIHVQESGHLSDLLSLDASEIRPEAYAQGQMRELGLEFNETITEHGDQIVLYQNVPNPWSGKTEISYFMPKKDDIKLNIYDVNGRLIYQEQKIAKTGMNSTTITHDVLETKGILYYELISGETRIVQKMVVID